MFPKPAILIFQRLERFCCVAMMELEQHLRKTSKLVD